MSLGDNFGQAIFCCFILSSMVGPWLQSTASIPMFEVLNTVSFAEEQGGKTKLTLHARVTKTTAAAARYLAGMEQGWSQSLDRMAEELES